MKKVAFVILTTLIAFFVGNVSAQSNAFPKGKIGVNAGFGFGNNTWGNGFMPTFNLAGDYAIKDVINDGGSISLGAFFGIFGLVTFVGIFGVKRISTAYAHIGKFYADGYFVVSGECCLVTVSLPRDFTLLVFSKNLCIEPLLRS